MPYGYQRISGGIAQQESGLKRPIVGRYFHWIWTETRFA